MIYGPPAAGGAPAPVVDTLPTRRRWPRHVGVLLGLLPIALAVGVELGALTAVSGALGHAASLQSSGDFAGAVGEYRAVSTLGGPVYALAQNRVDAAGADADRAELAWGQSLAAHGQIDAALSVIAGVSTTGPIGDDARRARAEVALTGARAAAGTGDFVLALRRLDLITAANAPADLAAQADSIRPPWAVSAARTELGGGDAIAAVTDLDEAAGRTGTREAAAARSLLPQALLAAARQALAALDRATAAALLHRLSAEYPSTSEARTGAAIAARPQSVGGTVVRTDGRAAAGLSVRLGSHFVQYPGSGGGYLTSAPFYYGQTDSHGDFLIQGIPVGGPYVLEVLGPQGWTTTIDDQTHQPAFSVTVDPLTPVDLTFVVMPA